MQGTLAVCKNKTQTNKNQGKTYLHIIKLLLRLNQMLGLSLIFFYSQKSNTNTLVDENGSSRAPESVWPQVSTHPYSQTLW